MLYYVLLIICLINVINTVPVKNEDELKGSLMKNTSKISLEVDSKISTSQEIPIHHAVKYLSIIGNPQVSSAELNLKYPLYFDSNIDEIVIKNINITGSLFFKGNKNITISSVNLNGYIDSDFNNEKTNKYIEITKLIYKSEGESITNCINLGGDVKIKNSKFYGDSSCQNRLLHYNGYGNYNFDLKDSNFNGGNKCPLLSIENASNVNIEYSNFEKAYSSKKIDGGYLKII